MGPGASPGCQPTQPARPDSALAQFTEPPGLRAQPAFRSQFVPGSADPGHPEIALLFADQTSLPPMLVFVADEEALRDDATRLVERARASGVDVRYERVSGVPHAWPVFQRVLPEGREAMRISGEFVDLQVQLHRATGSTVVCGAAVPMEPPTPRQPDAPR